MSTSSKDFIALAAALSHARPLTQQTKQRAQWEYDVRQVASALTDLSSTFDFQRFMAACHEPPYGDENPS